MFHWTWRMETVAGGKFGNHHDMVAIIELEGFQTDPGGLHRQSTQPYRCCLPNQSCILLPTNDAICKIKDLGSNQTHYFSCLRMHTPVFSLLHDRRSIQPLAGSTWVSNLGCNNTSVWQRVRWSLSTQRVIASCNILQVKFFTINKVICMIGGGSHTKKPTLIYRVGSYSS